MRPNRDVIKLPDIINMKMGRFDLKIVKKPDFLIVGAQKCGTTSLFHYLSQHPLVYMPEVKEVHFFDLNYQKGVKWYLNHFRVPFRFGKQVVAGEASPYYFFHPLVPERVARHLPSVKLIFMLRNPVTRAHSHFYHQKKLGTEALDSFREAVAREAERIGQEELRLQREEIEFSQDFQDFSYVARGMYARQIERWLRFFPMSGMHFIKSEDFYTSPHDELRRVHRFLGIPEIIPEDINPQNSNEYPALEEEFANELKLLFDEDSKKLTGLIGQKFQW